MAGMKVEITEKLNAWIAAIPSDKKKPLGQSRITQIKALINKMLSDKNQGRLNPKNVGASKRA